MARIDPCLATLVDKPPKEPVWAFEVMWDRYRRRYCEVPPFSRAEH